MYKKTTKKLKDTYKKAINILIPKKELQIPLLYGLGILFVSLLIKAKLFVLYTDLGRGDGLYYMMLGKNLINNGTYNFVENYNYGIIFPPFYPILVGLFDKVINNLLLSAKLISIISSLVTSVILFFVGKKITSNVYAGLYLLTTYSFYPFLLSASVIPETESVYFLLFSIIILIHLYWKEKIELFNSTIYGILIGISILTRPEAILLLILPTFIIIKKILTKKFTKHHIFSIFALFIFSILTVLPYSLFLNKEAGMMSFSGKNGINWLVGEIHSNMVSKDYYYKVNPEGNNTLIESINNDFSLISYIKEINKTLFIKRYFFNLKEALGLLIFLLIPIIIYFYRSIHTKHIVNHVELLAFATLHILLISNYFILSRLTFPSLFILIILSTYGFRDIFNTSFRFKYLNLKNTSIIFTIICLLSYSLYVVTKPVSKTHTYYEEISNILVEKYQVSSNTNIMASSPWIGFYSKSKYTLLPIDAPEKVKIYAFKNYVDYIVLTPDFINYIDFFNSQKDIIKIEENKELIVFKILQ